MTRPVKEIPTTPAENEPICIGLKNFRLPSTVYGKLPVAFKNIVSNFRI
jgi:hypothetical protein